ncbi:MAG: ATP-dependent nuclease [Thermoanaerobaculia bacterium]
MIDRFRGIRQLDWCPADGLNVILGGGDVGKTTILEAIALLLSPTNATLLTDADYHARTPNAEFAIEAVMSLAPSSGISQEAKPSWPWVWDGEKAVAPGTEGAAASDDDAVYRLRVRGTEDLDLEYEILQPDETTVHLSVAIRRRIGLVRLGGDDRNDRDLRLVRGSALERLLGDKTLRSRLGKRLAEVDVTEELASDARTQLTELGATFKVRALPTDLSLGMTGGPGLSLNALIGLTAARESAQLPLSSWGSGTRRLAALEIAAVRQGDAPIVVIDELERGLEPYRQRSLVARVAARPSQVFLTTHSAAVLEAASEATLWYLDARGKIGCLATKTAAHRFADPDAYLARLPIIVEGATEVGFVTALLERRVVPDLLQEGIVVSDGGGNDSALGLLDALSVAGLSVAGFVDDEGRSPTAWTRVKDRLGPLLFRWGTGCVEANVIPLVPDDKLEAFLTPPEAAAGERLRTLQERLGLAEKDFATIRANAPDLKRLIIEAATGSIPPEKHGLPDTEKKAWKSHGQKWFKSVAGGQELEEKVVTFGLWDTLSPVLRPFLAAVQQFTSGGGVPPES